ncbi:MAG: RluA family pseudouridine synthase [Bacilli bacterium]|nr:RluA family pseudouridine synthase [Bacilli bacterium]
MNYSFKISEELNGLRLDKALVLLLKDKSRSYLLSLIDEGKCLVNGKIAKASLKVKISDEVSIEIPEPKPLEIKSENIPLDIIYEDDDILIINKPQGLVVHPSLGHYEGTLVNAILHHCNTLSGINGVMRPGIIHRIDKETSGLLCIAKNDHAHKFLSEQLKEHTMKREYYALCKGLIKENNGIINLPIGRNKNDRKKMGVDRENGKEAITYFKVEERFKNHTLISCKLKTGRTHQIRVHLSYIGYPIEGDKLYSKRANKVYNEGQLLHAYRLTLIHPTTKKEMTFQAPLPDYFIKVIEELKNN